MSISVFKYSSANTRAKALYGKLLTERNYEELLGMSTVQDIAAYLKKSAAYGSLLSAINTSLADTYQEAFNFLFR